MTGYNIWRTAPPERFSGGGLGGVRPLPMSAEDEDWLRIRKERAMPAARAATATRLSLAARVFGLARIAIAKGGSR